METPRHRNGRVSVLGFVCLGFVAGQATPAVAGVVNVLDCGTVGDGPLTCRSRPKAPGCLAPKPPPSLFWLDRKDAK